MEEAIARYLGKKLKHYKTQKKTREWKRNKKNINSW
jgi:hypothetical protein